MTNLTQKIDEVQGQLTTQHEQLLGQLNSILTALALIENINGTLNSIYSEVSNQNLLLTSIGGSIDRLVEAIAPTNEALPSEAKSSLAWSLYRLMDATAPAWPRPAGQPLQPQLSNLWQLFQPVVGVDLDAERSILYYMARLVNISLLNSVGVEPPGELEEAIPIVQLGASLANGRNYARWPNMAANGVQYSQSIAGVPENCEITPMGGGTWSGWRVFVQTNAPYVQRNRGDLVDLIEPNVLLNMDPSRYAFALSVGQEFHINAILYAPTYVEQIYTAAFASTNWVRYGDSIGTYSMPAWEQGVGQSNEPYRDQTQFYAGLRAWFPLPGAEWEYRVRTQGGAVLGLRALLYNEAGFTNNADALADGEWHLLDDGGWTYVLFNFQGGGFAGYVDIRQNQA